MLEVHGSRIPLTYFSSEIATHTPCRPHSMRFSAYVGRIGRDIPCCSSLERSVCSRLPHAAVNISTAAIKNGAIRAAYLLIIAPLAAKNPVPLIASPPIMRIAAANGRLAHPASARMLQTPNAAKDRAASVCRNPPRSIADFAIDSTYTSYSVYLRASTKSLLTECKQAFTCRATSAINGFYAAFNAYSQPDNSSGIRSYGFDGPYIEHEPHWQHKWTARHEDLTPAPSSSSVQLGFLANDTSPRVCYTPASTPTRGATR